MGELDFELEVRSTGNRVYEVAVLHSPAGGARMTMQFPFKDLELRVRLLALENALLRAGGTRRQILSPEDETVREFGRELFDALIDGDVRSTFDASLAEANRRGDPLRIKLRFDTPALSTLPWEFLFDRRGRDYLALSTSTPLVRYIGVPEASRPLTVNGPLRMLGMVASPSDLPDLDVHRERQRIEEATADLRDRGLIELHWLEKGTYRELQQTLRREKWHVFHFAGHGMFDAAIDEGLVAFVDETAGTADRVPATQLGRLLGDHKPLRLAVLNACEGARGSTHDMFSSTAATLVQMGTPAVVAMQYDITDDAAKEFSRSFYEAIADSLPVDIAMTEARKSLSHAIANTLEWGTPVLFMRTDDGVLFKVRPAPARPPGVVSPAAAEPVVAVIAPPSEPAIAAAAAPPAIAPPTPPPATAPAVVAATPPPEARSAASIAAVVPPDVIVRPQRRFGSLAAIGGFVVAAAVGGAILARVLLPGDPTGSPSPTVPSSLPPSQQPATSAPSSAPASASVSPPATRGTLQIAIDLPESNHSSTPGIVDAVKLAIKDADGQVGLWKVEASTPVFDHGQVQAGVDNVKVMVATPAVIGLIGPYTSAVAAAQIPESNQAGLLQCTPSAASPSLTLPSTRPIQDEVNFVRTVARDDSDAPAAAKFILENLRKSRVYIIAIVDGEIRSAIDRADRVTTSLAEGGGIFVGRDDVNMNTTDLASIVTKAAAQDPEVIFVSGSSRVATFAAKLLKQVRETMPSTVVVASGEVMTASFINSAAGSLNDVYSEYPAVGAYPGRSLFESRYTNEFNVSPTLYSPTAYMCAHVILNAIGRAGDSTDLAAIRRSVRAAAVDPAFTYHTLIDGFHFGADGEISKQIVTIYQVTNGRWVADQQVEIPR